MNTEAIELNSNTELHQESSPEQAPKAKRAGRKKAARCSQGHVIYGPDGKYVPFDAPEIPPCRECAGEREEAPQQLSLFEAPEPDLRAEGEQRVRAKGPYARSVCAAAFRLGFGAVGAVVSEEMRARLARAYDAEAAVVEMSNEGNRVVKVAAGDGIAWAIADVAVYYGVDMDHPLLVAVANAAVCAATMAMSLKS